MVLQRVPSWVDVSVLTLEGWRISPRGDTPCTDASCAASASTRSYAAALAALAALSCPLASPSSSCRDMSCYIPMDYFTQCGVIGAFNRP